MWGSRVWLWREAKISSSSNDESPLEGSRFCSTSSSLELASDVGGHGEWDLVGESDGGTRERSMCLRWCEELAEALSELALERGALSVKWNMSNACHDLMLCLCWNLNASWLKQIEPNKATQVNMSHPGLLGSTLVIFTLWFVCLLVLTSVASICLLVTELSCFTLGTNSLARTREFPTEVCSLCPSFHL